MEELLEIEDRVRKNTDPAINQKIEEAIEISVRYYTDKTKNEIDTRIQQLDKAWSVERVLEVFSATLSLAGLGLAAYKNKRWLALSGIVNISLLQHAVQGWSPSLTLFRFLGFRTRKELDWEKFALKALKGDFDILDKGLGLDQDLDIVAAKALTAVQI
jgi:hypothetical protein